MIFNAENILLIGSILLFVSIVVSKTGYRFGIPTLLVFLLVGMLFGSDGLGLQFHDAGEAQFIGMMALSIILFSGGMDTKYSDIKPVLPQGILLSTFGVLLTTIFTGFFIYWISGFSNVSITMSLMTAMLLAATMSSTDSASVFNILRSQSMNLKHNLRPMLELESGSNSQKIGIRQQIWRITDKKRLIFPFPIAWKKTGVISENTAGIKLAPMIGNAFFPIAMTSLLFEKTWSSCTGKKTKQITPTSINTQENP